MLQVADINDGEVPSSRGLEKSITLAHDWASMPHQPMMQSETNQKKMEKATAAVATEVLLQLEHEQAQQSVQPQELRE